MSPCKKCQDLLSPFRNRKKETGGVTVTKLPHSPKHGRGLSNLAFAMDSDENYFVVKSKATENKRVSSCRTFRAESDSPRKQLQSTMSRTSDSGHKVSVPETTDKADNHSRDFVADLQLYKRDRPTRSGTDNAANSIDSRCGSSTAETMAAEDKCSTNQKACQDKIITFEVERPDSIRLAAGYDPLMDLASPLGLVSPTDDPLLYTRMLLSVAKCSTEIYHSRYISRFSLCFVFTWK